MWLRKLSRRVIFFFVLMCLRFHSSRSRFGSCSFSFSFPFVVVCTVVQVAALAVFVPFDCSLFFVIHGRGVFESRAIVSARSALLFDFILRGLAQPARSHGVCGTSINVAVRVDLVAPVCVVAYVHCTPGLLFSSSLTGAGVARGLVGLCVFDVRRRHVLAPHPSLISRICGCG